MAQWVGWAVSVNCGEPLGCYQGTILRADGATVTLTKAFRNGFPYPKAQVTLNASDIKEIKMIDGRTEPSEQTHSTVAVGKGKKAQRAPPAEAPQAGARGDAARSPERASLVAQCAEGATGRPRAADGQPRAGKGSAVHATTTACGQAGAGAVPKARERARRRDAACFGGDDAALLGDFDFEKNLALFDKRAVWEELRHSHKPDVVRQTEPGGGGKLRHDENVLSGAPAALHAIRVADDSRGPTDYVTDEGVVVPSVCSVVRRRLWEGLQRCGLLEQALLLLARAAADLALRLVGGGRRLDPRNVHQLPRVVVLAGAHREGACGVMVARLLASHGVRTAVLAVGGAGAGAECSVLRRALAAYALCGHPTVESAGELPSADLVVVALADPERPEPRQFAEAAAWARDSRAALLAVEPPSEGTAGLRARACVVAGLPLAHGSANGRVYLADVAVPARLLRDLTLAYRPPFGAAPLLALHPSDAPAPLDD